MGRIFSRYNGLEAGTGGAENGKTKGTLGSRRRRNLVHGLAVYHRLCEFNLVENHPGDRGLAVVSGTIPEVMSGINIGRSNLVKTSIPPEITRIK
jgi:hypothetical protein